MIILWGHILRCLMFVYIIFFMLVWGIYCPKEPQNVKHLISEAT